MEPSGALLKEILSLGVPGVLSVVIFGLWKDRNRLITALSKKSDELTTCIESKNAIFEAQAQAAMALLKGDKK